MIERFETCKSPLTVGKTGIKIFALLFGANHTETLTELRFLKYQSMIARSHVLEPQRMPPTERAAYFHALRVYIQVRQWSDLNTESLDPCFGGWQRGEKTLEPIPTDKGIAPTNVLQFIRCKCKAQNTNQCKTNLCSCHKHGLKCVDACGHGVTCKNTQGFDFDE